MMFYEKLQNATAEEDVKTAYIKALGLPLRVERHPGRYDMAHIHVGRGVRNG